MIRAEIHRNGQLLMNRIYYEPSLSLEMVLKNLEMYVVNEQLNIAGECLLRARFENLQKAS